MTEANSSKRRVTILIDTETHMMPALAREMASRDHNLVIANVAEGLVAELESLGAEVEVIPDRLDMGLPGTFQKLADAATQRFGRFDSACVRTGAHGTGTILDATVEESQYLYEGNFLQAFLALSELLPPLVAQGSGQVVINTSASGLRPAPSATLYSAFRAAANSLVRSAGLTVGQSGVTVNATGTYAMDYPSFIEDTGADDPEVRKQIEQSLPLGRLVQPEEAAYFVASLIDGKGTGQTSQFFAIDAGWAEE